MNRRPRGEVWALGLWALGACGGDDASRPNAAKTVMVIDEGFDLSSPELQGKVIGAFTIDCLVSSGSAGTPVLGDAGTPDDVEKQRFITALTTRDDHCHLREGIADKPDPLSLVARFRPRWNDMIRRQLTANHVFTQAEFAELAAAVDAELATFDYHGTATAGVVAHANPGVRLVLVEQKLGSASAIEASFQCLVQGELDRAATLLRDPDVLSAYARAPASALATELADLAARLEAGFVNQSFGPIARADLEAIQLQAGCPPIDARAYFSALHDATVARLGVTGPPRALFIQSAGNEAVAIESGADEMTCLPEDPTHLLVGSHDLAGALSKFSNFGACVDVFAPGENIVAPYAGGWLFPVAGTSFSAPLVAWRLSRLTPSPFDLEQAGALAREKPALAPSEFPRDFFYAPGGVPAPRTTGALTATGWARPSPAAAARRRVSRAELAAALRPVTILRELSGRQPRL